MHPAFWRGPRRGGSALTARRYFTYQDAYNLLGRRVQARVAISRRGLRDLGLWVTEGRQGTVARLAFGPCPDEYLIGIRWDAPPPAIPRRASYPIDWYTAEEHRSLLEPAVKAAA